MIRVGQTAPDFELPDHEGNAIALTDVLSQQRVLLYFYPIDFSPVCTAQACAFRDRHGDLAAADVRVLGVSPQDASTHARFVESNALPFALLADPDKSVIRAYGVDGPMGFGVRRATFLIDQKQIVQNRIVSDFLVSSHIDLINETLEDSA